MFFCACLFVDLFDFWSNENYFYTNWVWFFNSKNKFNADMIILDWLDSMRLLFCRYIYTSHWNKLTLMNSFIRLLPERIQFMHCILDAYAKKYLGSSSIFSFVRKIQVSEKCLENIKNVWETSRKFRKTVAMLFKRQQNRIAPRLLEIQCFLHPKFQSNQFNRKPATFL